MFTLNGSRILCIGLALLAGCGGGGGQAEETVESYTPESYVALAIDSSNSTAALQVPAIYSEALQALAYDTMRWVERFAATPSATLTWACEAGGSVTLSWSDADLNGRLGPGDTLDLALADCGAPAAATIYTGSMQLSMRTPREPDALAARVSLSAGLRFGAGGLNAAWKGAFNVERLVLERSDDLWVTAAAADQLRIEFAAPGIEAVDRFESVDSTRTATQDWQGTSSLFDLTLASDILRGKVVLSTPVAVFAYFDTFPFRGVLEVAGNGRAQLRSVLGQRNAALEVTDGPAAGYGSNFGWPEVMQGLAWVGPGPLPQQYAAVRDLATVPFDYVGSSSPQIDPLARTVQWQFNRALRNTPAIAAARLNRVGGGWGAASIAAVVEVTGAHATVRWTDQLEPGMRYDVEWLDSNGQTSTPYSFARLGSFGEENANIAVPAQIAVTNSVEGNIVVPATRLLVPGSALRLNASASGSAPLRYRWSQTEGMAVVLSSLDQPATDVTLPANAGAAPGDVTLELEVTDARGVVDRQSVRLRAAPSPSTSILTVLRGSAGAPFLDGTSVQAAHSLETFARLNSGGSSPYVRALLGLGQPIDGGSVFFFLPAGASLQPGTYQAPVSAFSRGDGPGILLNTANATCDGAGSFTIHEAVLGSPDGSIDGTPIAQLAVDFTISCAGAPPLSGAIRISSARPLPP